MSKDRSDAQRFEAIYRTQYGAVVRFAHRRTAAENVEEVLAETFTVAWRRLGEVPADPLPWLYVVARNVIRAKHRAAASAADKAANQAVLGSHMGRDPADALGERELIWRAFGSLPDGDREALRLVAWEGLDHRRAALASGTSQVAFAMRVSRARRRLAAALNAAQPVRDALAIPNPSEEGNL